MVLVPSTDPFKVLGLKRATATQADVKAAYARLLKVTRPEDDRDAFMQLRAAFDSARQIAKAKDAQQVDPFGDAQMDAPVGPAPAQVKWHYDKDLDWHFDDSAMGTLIEDTVRWMLKGGPDAEGFTAEVAERQIASSGIDPDVYRVALIGFLVKAADPAKQLHTLAAWERFQGTRPDWLNIGLMRVLNDDLRVLDVQPHGSYDARNLNTVRDMFADVLDAEKALPEPLDVIEILAKETYDLNKDAHGSYFDKQSKEWVDLSPVSVAMRDLLACFQKGAWDKADVCRDILARDELQSMDEFQDIDARLRAYICQETGMHTAKHRPDHPDWLTKSLVLLLDDTFGWSRHFGRNYWDQQQFTWLHKVIARDRKPDVVVPQFQAMQPAPQPVVVHTGTDFDKYFAFFFGSPLRILAVYFGYRVTQVIWRLVA